MQWLRTMPLAHYENDYLMVHAGVLPMWDADRVMRLAAEASAAINGEQWYAFAKVLYGDMPDNWLATLNFITTACLFTALVCAMNIRLCLSVIAGRRRADIFGMHNGVIMEGMTICAESYVGRIDGGEGVKYEDQYLITANGAQYFIYRIVRLWLYCTSVCGKQMDIVIAQHQSYHRAVLVQPAQSRQRLFAAIYHIANQPQTIARAVKTRDIQQTPQQIQTAVNIADSVSRHRHSFCYCGWRGYNRPCARMFCSVAAAETCRPSATTALIYNAKKKKNDKKYQHRKKQRRYFDCLPMRLAARHNAPYSNTKTGGDFALWFMATNRRDNPTEVVRRLR